MDCSAPLSSKNVSHTSSTIASTSSWSTITSLESRNSLRTGEWVEVEVEEAAVVVEEAVVVVAEGAMVGGMGEAV